MELIRYSEQPYDQQYLQKIAAKSSERDSALKPGDAREPGGAESVSTDGSTAQGDPRAASYVASVVVGQEEEAPLPSPGVGPPAANEDDRAGPANVTFT